MGGPSSGNIYKMRRFTDDGEINQQILSLRFSEIDAAAVDIFIGQADS